MQRVSAMFTKQQYRMVQNHLSDQQRHFGLKAGPFLESSYDVCVTCWPVDQVTQLADQSPYGIDYSLPGLCSDHYFL